MSPLFDAAKSATLSFITPGPPTQQSHSFITLVAQKRFDELERLLPNNKKKLQQENILQELLRCTDRNHEKIMRIVDQVLTLHPDLLRGEHFKDAITHQERFAHMVNNYHERNVFTREQAQACLKLAVKKNLPDQVAFLAEGLSSQSGVFKQWMLTSDSEAPPMEIMFKNKAYEIYKIFLLHVNISDVQNEEGKTLLHLFADMENGHEFIKITLEECPKRCFSLVEKMDKAKTTPIMIAAKNTNASAITELLRCGADYDKIKKGEKELPMISRARGGDYPLHLDLHTSTTAIMRRPKEAFFRIKHKDIFADDELIGFVKENNISPNVISPDGNSLQMEALLNSRYKLAEALMHHPDIIFNITNKEGKTPFIIACEVVHLDSIRFMNDKTDATILRSKRDHQGKTAMTYMCESYQRDIEKARHLGYQEAAQPPYVFNVGTPIPVQVGEQLRAAASRNLPTPTNDQPPQYESSSKKNNLS